MLVPHKPSRIGRVRHLLRALKVYAEPVGNRLDHEASQDVAARERVDGETHDVGFRAGDQHGKVVSRSKA